MSSPYQPPQVPQQVPASMLQYSSTHGQQPIPMTPEYAELLNQAGEFAAGARLLKISGISDFFWGTIIVFGGFLLMAISLGRIGPKPLPIWIAAAALTLGSVLLASAVWLVFFPTPGAMIVDGMSLILLSLINGTWYTIDRMRGSNPSKIWIAVFVVCLLSGIARFRRYKRFKRASMTAPPRETLKWLDDLRRSLRKVKPERDVSRGTFKFDSINAWPPVMCKGRITPQMLICLINNEKVQFYRKGDLAIEPPPGPHAAKVKAKMMLSGRSFNAFIPLDSLARLLAWQAPDETLVLLGPETQSPPHDSLPP